MSAMFNSLDVAPPDPILGLSEAFAKDPNPRKINLSVGVYQDETGVTPILASVKQAEKRLAEEEKSKSYLPISGSPKYAGHVQQLLFGDEHEVITSGRIATVHTPGGTGALRVAGDFLKECYPESAIWCSSPTWANHPSIFAASGRAVHSYPYLDADRNALDFSAMLAAVSQMPPGDVILLHGCCHNPSGIDPTIEQWSELGERLAERGILPLVDFAYQGFAEGLLEDAMGLQAICRECPEVIIASSFSKNFGLYRERVGALTVVTEQSSSATAVMSHLKRVIRSNYSNPPAHGGAVVETILGDAKLRSVWEGEVTAMRTRINGTRKQFVEQMKQVAPQRDFSFIERQRGMFSFSGLNPEQVNRLRDEYAIYIVGSGRINVAGMTPKNLEPLCQAIAAVL